MFSFSFQEKKFCMRIDNFAVPLMGCLLCCVHAQEANGPRKAERCGSHSTDMLISDVLSVYTSSHVRCLYIFFINSTIFESLNVINSR